MKLIVLHGLGEVALLNKLSSIKEKFDSTEIVELDGKQISFNQAQATIKTPLLFTNDRLIIMENFPETVDLKLINIEDLGLTLVLKYSKTLTATSPIVKLANQLKGQILGFNEENESLIFPLLDLLIAKKPLALVLFEKSYLKYGGQYIFVMLIFMLRRLILPPKSTPEFALKKIAQDKARFPDELIAKYYREILLTDYKIKSGLLDEKLALNQLINIFLV